MAGSEIAFVFGGGGARGAYQVGILRHIARRYPDLQIPILTGVSAGAINAAYLANHTGSLPQKVEDLTRLWCSVTIDRVFRVDTRSLVSHLLRWGAQLTLLGGRTGVPNMRGMVDTAPLRAFLEESFGSPDGALAGSADNLARGSLRAVAVTATDYGSGRTVIWYQGREIDEWDRPQRVSVRTELRIEHVMASAALPLFFPAVEVGGRWYGDGGIRLHAPLSPAIRLGGQRIVAVSTLTGSQAPAEPGAARVPTPGEPEAGEYPSPARIAGVLYRAVFLDLLDQDALMLDRINDLLERASNPPADLRPIRLFIVRPSEDPALFARDYEPNLPRVFRFLMRRLGTGGGEGYELLSMLLFQREYIQRLIELGEADAEARADEIAKAIEA